MNIPTPPGLVPANLNELAGQWKICAPLILSLHGRIIRLSGRKDIKACCKRLDMEEEQFNNPLAMDILLDYLLYMYQPRGLSLVRQACNRRIARTEEERRLLAAMCQARFSLFLIEALVPEGGLIALDVLHNEQLFLLDPDLPQRPDSAGMLLWMRVFPFHEAFTHTGTAFAMGGIDPGKVPASDIFDRFKEMLKTHTERQINELAILLWRRMQEEEV